jgi:hypothetical protein
MPRPCAICVHERQGEVEAALRNNEPYLMIAKRFGTSVTAVLGHRLHFSGSPEGPATAPEPATAADVLDQMKALEGNCCTLLEIAADTSEAKVVFSVIGQVRKTLESLMELTSRLGQELKAHS